MICADPWEETARLEALLEIELTRTMRGTRSRIPAEAFDDAGAGTVSAVPPRQGSPSFVERSTLGFFYAGYPYKIDHT